MRRAALIGASVLALGLAGPAPSLAESPQGQFATPCKFSHRLPDDPIVSPGAPGASHMHEFFGNRSTGAHSTYRSMRASGTTCKRSADTAGYWVPVLYDTLGAAITPRSVAAYYLTAGKDPRTLRAFPANLKLIAGDSRASGPQPRRVMVWSCKSRDGTMGRGTGQVPLCPLGSRLVLNIRFPDCWNGTALDSASHKSHLSYSIRAGRGARHPRVCPRTHPVPVPAIALHVHYPSGGGLGFSLASGGTQTAHADFWNTWRQRALERLVKRCLNAAQHCDAS